MDYKKCINTMSKCFNDLELDYEVQNESDNTLFMLSVDIEGLMDEVRTDYVLFDDGCLLVNMQFNKIDVNEKVLRQINEFNNNSQFFKCILDGNDNVLLTFSTPLVNEDTVEGVIKMLFYEFTIEEEIEEFKAIIG